uniref:Cadherin domain-containing protein n=1 Tax=Syphacia muris TaxID=451379 RepID=A0A0N5ARC1_9BILA
MSKRTKQIVFTVSIWIRRLLSLMILSWITMINGCLLENDRSSIYVSVLENAAPGSALTNLPIQGVTFGPEPDTQLKLVKGNDIVDLDARQKKLILKKALDRDEGESKFEVVIECKSLTDNDFPQINISTFVSVMDVNDNAPEFEADSYSFKVPEELPIGTIVFTELKATDKDQLGPNSFLTYRILPGENSHYLAIDDPTVPKITVAERIDFEKLTSFEILIEAKDDGDPILSTIVKAHITVIDIDDLNPVFNYDYYTATPSKNGVIEVKPEKIHAVDGDTLGVEIQYSLHGENSEFFAIDNQGTVKALTEYIPSSTLMVKASQVDWADRFAIAVLKISNDSFIHFELPLYSIRVMSNSAINSEVIRLTAVSPQKTNGITYSMSIDNTNNNDTPFMMSPKTGAVRVIKSIKDKFYSYRLTANDGKRLAHSRLDVYIIGSHAPRFDKNDYSFEVGSASFVGQVHATDSDANDSLKYSVVNLQKLFSIDKDGYITKLNDIPAYNELVVACEDSSAQKTLTTVTIRSTKSLLSVTTVLTAIIFLLLIVICVVVVIFVVKRVSMLCRKNECWVTKTGDNAIVISASLDSDNLRTLSMKRNSSKEFVNEESDRDCMNYSHSMMFMASPNQSPNMQSAGRPPLAAAIAQSISLSDTDRTIIANKKPTVYF